MGETTFTQEELQNLKKLAQDAPALIAMHENFERAGWLGRLMWKVAVAAGATVALIAALKGHILSIIR